MLATAALAEESWLDPVRALDRQGRSREALEQLDSEPGRLAADTEARLLRGVLLAKLGRTAEARELYQRLILEKPDLPEAYNNLAVMHAAAGDYDTAIEILKQGLGTHPSYRTTYDNLTKVYGKLAGEAYSKALGDERIDPEPLRLALINVLTPSTRSRPALPPATPSEPFARPRLEPQEAQAEARTPQEQMPAAGAESQPSSEPDSSPLVPAPSPTPAPVAPAEVVQQAPPEQAIWQRVESWADAWAGQRADSYISFYAADFVPAGGGSRAEWEALRRRRLAAPEYIKISLALLGVEQPGADRAIVRFVQSYESDRFRDTVTKALELARIDGEWRIVREEVEESSG